MSKGFTDWPDLGFFPLQDVQEDVPIGMRMALVGGRVLTRPEPGEGGSSKVTEYAREHGLGTLGDIHPWLFWQTKEREKRAMGSWSMSWAGIVTDAASIWYGGTAGVQPLTKLDDSQVNDYRYRVLKPAWERCLPWQPEGMLAMVMPSTDETEPGSVMLNGDRRLVSASASGPGAAGTTICDMQPDGVLCMDGSVYPGYMGRQARLQSLIRVIALDQYSAPMLNTGTGYNGLAINYGKSQQDGILGYGMIFGKGISAFGPPVTGQSNQNSTGNQNSQTTASGPGGAPPLSGRGGNGFASPGGGPMGGDAPEGPGAGEQKSVAGFGEFRPKPMPQGAVGFMAHEASGPIVFGCTKHVVGTDKDGHNMTSAHITSNAYFFKNGDQDGPLLFEDEFPEELDEHPNETHVHLSWDKKESHGFVGGARRGVWRWWTTVPYFRPWSTPTPPTASGPHGPTTPSSPSAPTTPGAPGVPGNPSGPSAPTGPAVPGGPTTPGGTPGGPAAPGTPGAPTTQPYAPGPPPAKAWTPQGLGPLTGLPGALERARDKAVSPRRKRGPWMPDDIPNPARPPGTKPGRPVTYPRGHGASPHASVDLGVTLSARDTGSQIYDGGINSKQIEDNGGTPGVIGQVGGSATGRDVGLYTIFNPFNTGFAAISMRPQLWIKGAPNFEHNPNLHSRTYRTEELTRPTVLTIRAWGAQNESGDWNYITPPDKSRARGGNVDGGILIAPAEFEMEDYLGINSAANIDAPEAAGYVTFAPRVAATFGKPTTSGHPSENSKLVYQTSAAGKLLIGEAINAVGSVTSILKIALLNGEGYVECQGTGAIAIPSGTTAERPSSPDVSMVRVNTTATALEYYAAGAWRSLTPGGGGAVDFVSNVATSTILGRVTAGSGNSEELTPTQVRTLINVADGADVSPVASVNAKTGTIVLNPDDLDDSSTTNKFTTAAGIVKLDGIEAFAEVNAVDSVNGQGGLVVLDLDDIADGTLRFGMTPDHKTMADNINSLPDDTMVGNISGLGGPPSSMTKAEILTLLGLDDAVQTRLFGVLRTNGTGTPTLEANSYNVASVSRTSLGLYTFTFSGGLGLTANAYSANMGVGVSTSAQFFVAEILTRTASVVTIEVRNASTLALADGGYWTLEIKANI